MIRVVWSGIDTWEESFTGDLQAQVLEELEAKKRQAQDEESPAPYQIAGRTFYVEPAGVRPWRYLLKSEDMQLRLGASSFAPALSGRLRPLGLVRVGAKPLRDELATVAQSLGLTSSGVTRVDIAADFQGWTPTVADMRGMVCDASFRPIYPNLDHPETFQFGKGDLVVRVYNKSKEIVVKRKEWLEAVWAECQAYVQEEDVWRFEVQLRRARLRELRCEDAASVFEKLPQILGFGLAWCNLRVPTGENQSRWPEDPRWSELRSASCAGEPLKRVRSINQGLLYSRASRMVISATLSAAAWIDETDLDTICGLLRKDLERYIAESGRDLATLVGERQRQQVSRS